MDKLPNAEAIAREVLYFNGLMFAPASWHYLQEYAGHYGLCESGMGLYLRKFFRGEMAFISWHPDAGYSVSSTSGLGLERTAPSRETLDFLELEGMSPSEIASKIKESRFAQYSKRHSRDRHNAHYVYRGGGSAEINELNYRGYSIIRDPRKRGQSDHWRFRVLVNLEPVQYTHALRSGICRIIDARENQSGTLFHFK